MSTHKTKRVTVPEILDRKTSSDSITSLTAYDYTMAKLIDSAGVDIILVGDSLGSVVQGLETTLPVTLDEMIYHSRCVTRAVERALVVGDLPFMSYQVSTEQALISSGRMMKEGCVGAVKLEGGVFVADTIAALTRFDIPVMGHVGLTPQSYHRMGGNKVQGKAADDKAGSRKRVIEDAIAVEEAGAFAVVLEAIPAELAQEITETVSIPTIGIGAGVGCDGQILVSYDMLGFNADFKPKFLKQFANIGEQITEATQQYCWEVKNKSYPAKEHSFKQGVISSDRSTRKRSNVFTLADKSDKIEEKEEATSTEEIQQTFHKGAE